MHLELLLLLLATGIIGGFLSGLLGIGGGMIFVPAIYFCLKAAGIGSEHIMHISVGTSMAVMVSTGISAAYSQYKKENIDFDIFKRWGVALLLGVFIGSSFASSVDGLTLKKIFAVVISLTAIYMVFSKERKVTHHKLSKTIQNFICLTIGTLSSMVGLSGSVFNVPLMNYIGVPMKRAIGTGSALTVAVTVPATITYMFLGLKHSAELPLYSIGFINLIALAIIISTSTFIAPLGVKASHYLPVPTLKKIFAVILIIVSVKMFMSI